MKTFLWVINVVGISLIIFGLRKGLAAAFTFRGGIEAICFITGLLIEVFAFIETTGFFRNKDRPDVLDDDYDDEFHNDFSKVGSGSVIEKVKPEDHALGSLATGKNSEFEKDLKKIDEDLKT